jgi:Ca2+/Na+ antiporter
VHGNLLGIINYSLGIFIFFLALFFVFLAIGILHFIKTKRHTLSLYNERRFAIILWVILALSFLFAALSNGNAEFMILIPFILVVIYATYFSTHKSILFTGLAMLVWNCCFALYPQRFLQLSCTEQVVDLMKTRNDATFVLIDKPMAENLYLYKYSSENLPKIVYAHKYKKEENLSQTIITDVIGAETPLSRSSLLNTCELEFEDCEKDSLLFKFESLGTKRELHLLQFRLK